MHSPDLTNNVTNYGVDFCGPPWMVVDGYFGIVPDQGLVWMIADDPG